jgi:hypothetical protein
MNLFSKIANFFDRAEPKTVAVPDPGPGGVIPLDDVQDNIILLPCPLQFQLTKACICMACSFLSKNCSMELLCRAGGCAGAFIGACTNYTNSEDINCDEKRKIFREGCTFDGRIIYFTSRKPKTDTTVGG